MLQQHPVSTYLSYSSREASTASKNSLIPLPVTLETPTAYCPQVPRLSQGNVKTYLEVLVELVKYQTHAIHKAVHIRRFALFIARIAVGGQRCLERFEILHPLDRKIMGLYIRLVEDEDKRELCFVQDTRCIHVPSEPFRNESE